MAIHICHLFILCVDVHEIGWFQIEYQYEYNLFNIFTNLQYLTLCGLNIVNLYLIFVLTDMIHYRRNNIALKWKHLIPVIFATIIYTIVHLIITLTYCPRLHHHQLDFPIQRHLSLRSFHIDLPPLRLSKTHLRKYQIK